MPTGANERMKSPGQLAYEEDCRHCPTYNSGKLRPAWQELSELIQSTWHMNPTAREYHGEIRCA